MKCSVRFKKVKNKLIEFFVVEPVGMTHQMGGVAQGKMQLEQKCELGKNHEETMRVSRVLYRLDVYLQLSCNR